MFENISREYSWRLFQLGNVVKVCLKINQICNKASLKKKVKSKEKLFSLKSIITKIIIYIFIKKNISNTLICYFQYILNNSLKFIYVQPIWEWMSPNKCMRPTYLMGLTWIWSIIENMLTLPKKECVAHRQKKSMSLKGFFCPHPH